ncbi:hypothetical protein [Actinoplanes sp. RD1]|uniref:hypothetical protein n=1 Tax=Actinoplanes sp. RD1 TaxID=3064538 RepID=UPI0027426753|nr:hypothetical protein [Actinoplanes sp. RD1]
MGNTTNQQNQAIDALLSVTSTMGPLAPSVLVRQASEKFLVSYDSLLIGWHYLLTEGRLEFTPEGNVGVVVERDEEVEEAIALSDLRSYVHNLAEAVHRHELIERMLPTTAARQRALWQALFTMTKNGELLPSGRDGKISKVSA